MSSILKALKKLEQEKSGHFPDSLNIDSDILKTTETPRSFSPLTFALLILIVFGGGAAAAFFFMKELQTPQKAGGIQPVIASGIQTAITSSLKNNDVPPAKSVVVITKDVTTQKQLLPQQVPGKQSKKNVSNSSPGGTGKENESTGTIKSGILAHTIPTLRVEGIAFQANGSENMAIVNGAAVSSGSKIEGVTVVDVQKDKILFQYDEEKFEIMLGQSNR